MNSVSRSSVSRITKRSVFRRFSSLGVAVSLAAAYGTFAAFALRFLYPTGKGITRGWQFVIEISQLAAGQSMTYVAPDGARVAIARHGRNGGVENFVALSSTCPHLGCQVHWEANNNRFFCPCHNGAFDAFGKAIAGPPAEANQDLPRYPLRIENGLLYIEVPLQGLARAGGLTKPGHDACLRSERA